MWCSAIMIDNVTSFSYTYRMLHIYIYTHPFNGPLSGTTQVGRYQKGKTNLDLLKQETVSGNGISWAICKSAPRSRQITTPAPHYSVFYRPDALPAAQPTASKHWRQLVRLQHYWQKPVLGFKQDVTGKKLKYWYSQTSLSGYHLKTALKYNPL